MKKVFLAVLALSFVLFTSGQNAFAGKEKAGHEHHAKGDCKDCPKKDCDKKDCKGENCPHEKCAVSDEAKKLMGPSDAHKVLADLSGKWNYTLQHRMGPDAPPQEMKGTSVNRMIMGGRFLQQEVKAPGSKDKKVPAFEGLGLVGYDNLKKEYFSTWVDNMQTGMMTATAQFDAAKNVMTERGTFSCPMTGQRNKAFRAVWTLKDKNSHTYEWFMKDEKGKEFKAMEIAYKRVK